MPGLPVKGNIVKQERSLGLWGACSTSVMHAYDSVASASLGSVGSGSKSGAGSVDRVKRASMAGRASTAVAGAAGSTSAECTQVCRRRRQCMYHIVQAPTDKARRPQHHRQPKIAQLPASPAALCTGLQARAPALQLQLPPAPALGQALSAACRAPLTGSPAAAPPQPPTAVPLRTLPVRLSP